MKALLPLKTSSMPRSVIASLLMILLISLIGLLAPLIAPYNPTRMQVGLSNYPPAWYNTPPKVGQPEHLLGTDFFGRDILSHIIHGARAAMFLVLIAIPLTAVIGVAVGILAGMGNRTLEIIFLRFTDIVSSVPTFMFAVILVLILRATPIGMVFGGLFTLTLAFALMNWVGLAKLLYASVLTIKQQLFMEAARSLGAGTFRQIFKHILPHIGYLLIVWIINNIPAIILLEALLGYVGIQILPATDGSGFQDLSWGGLILIGRTSINRNPFILLVPTLCILVISMSFSVLGDYLNERLNPQLQSNNLL